MSCSQHPCQRHTGGTRRSDPQLAPVKVILGSRDGMATVCPVSLHLTCLCAIILWQHSTCIAFCLYCLLIPVPLSQGVHTDDATLSLSSGPLSCPFSCTRIPEAFFVFFRNEQLFWSRKMNKSLRVCFVLFLESNSSSRSFCQKQLKWH